MENEEKKKMNGLIISIFIMILVIIGLISFIVSKRDALLNKDNNSDNIQKVDTNTQEDENKKSLNYSFKRLTSKGQTDNYYNYYDFNINGKQFIIKDLIVDGVKSKIYLNDKYLMDSSTPTGGIIDIYVNDEVVFIVLNKGGTVGNVKAFDYNGINIKLPNEFDSISVDTNYKTGALFIENNQITINNYYELNNNSGLCTTKYVTYKYENNKTFTNIKSVDSNENLAC